MRRPALLAAALNYTEPPFYVVLLGTTGIILLMMGCGLMRRIFLGMMAGGVGAACIAWYVLGKGSGDLVGMVQLIGTPASGVVGALACGFTGFVGKWVRRNPNT
jgi:hypothetical protein